MQSKSIFASCLVCLTGLSAGCGSSDERGYQPPPSDVRAQAATHTTSSTKGFEASMTAAGHKPVVGKPWRWSIEVQAKDGKPLAATTKTQFLLGGRVVGRGGSHSFTGSSKSSVRWPERSVGFPLVFRVVVQTKKGTTSLDYPVQVRKP